MSVTKLGNNREFHEALREIAKLSPLERRLLCKAASIYFASPTAHDAMSRLGELPHDHPLRLIDKHRAVHAMLLLLQRGVLPARVSTLVFERGAEGTEEN